MNWNREGRGKPKERRVRKVTAASIEGSAFHYLARFSTSIANLRRVLLRRARRSAIFHGTDPDEAIPWIDDVIAKLIRLELLDDEAYARNRARALLGRGKSARAIRASLAAKGLPSEVIDNTLNRLGRDLRTVNLEAAMAYAKRRKFGPYGGAHGLPREKQLAALGRAGFPYDVARTIVAADSAEALELEITSSDTIVPEP